MAKTPTEAIREEVKNLAREAIRHIQPHVPSTTIRDTLKFRIEKTTSGIRLIIFSPYYWAGIIHQGYGTVHADFDRWLVYFRNPSDDPRLQPWKTYPKTLADVKHLTKEQFYEGMAINRELAKNGGGKFQYMVVTKSVPGREGVPFMLLGVLDFVPEMHRRFSRKIFENIVETLKNETGRITAQVRL